MIQFSNALIKGQRSWGLGCYLSFPGPSHHSLGLKCPSWGDGIFSFHNLVLVAVTAENPTLQREDVGNGSRLFSTFVAISGYAALTLILNVWRSEVVSNIL